MTPQPKPTAVRDPAWLKVVRGMPCWTAGRDHHICGETIGNGLSECSHLDGKSRDDRVLPLCGLAHRTGTKAWHAGQRTFCRYHHTTKAALIREAESLYAAYRATR